MKSTRNGVSPISFAYVREPRQLQNHDVCARERLTHATIEIAVVEQTRLEWAAANRGPEKSDERVPAPCRVPLDPKRQIGRRRTVPVSSIRDEQAHLVSEPVRGRPRIPANWSASI